MKSSFSLDSLKGGERMHFPRFVLKGLIIGAALCFPSVVLADKNDHAPASNDKKTIPVVSSLKGNGFGNNLNSSKEHLKKKQKKDHHQVNLVHKSLPNVAKKAVNGLKNGHARNIIHAKDKQKQKNPGLKKGHFKTNKNKNSSVSGMIHRVKTEKPEMDVKKKSVPNLKPHMEKQVTIIKKPDSVSSIRKTVKAKKSLSTRISDSSNLVSKPKKDSPVPVKKLPQDIQIITTTTLGGNNSTGGSNDRYNIGTSTMSIAGWFEWGHYKLPSFDRLFISRSHELCNQWTNAPPVQPPK